MEEVFLQTLERTTVRLTARQRAMYAAEAPFVDKWRTAMSYLSEDLRSGYQKLWFELQAMAWNRPPMRARIAVMLNSWVDVLRTAFAAGMKELGIDRRELPVDAAVALVATFNQGIMLERLSGVDSGHDVLLATIDRWLSRRQKTNRPRPRLKRKGKRDG